MTKYDFNCGDDSKEEGDDTYYLYEFELVEGVGEMQPGLYMWSAPKTYFRRLDPLMQMGHRVFKITRTHTKGERPTRQHHERSEL
ncbi:MAG: hypothetical protein WCF23_16525 [Candidatus Nitrosopolaris sp.]